MTAKEKKDMLKKIKKLALQYLKLTDQKAWSVFMDYDLTADVVTIARWDAERDEKVWDLQKEVGE